MATDRRQEPAAPGPADREAELSPAKRALLQQRLARRRTASQSSDAGPVRREGDGAFVLSSAQQRLWLLDRLHPGLTAYNVPRVLSIRGPLDMAALGTALTGIVERHDVLRSAIAIEDGEPVQRAVPTLPVGIEQTDVATEPDPDAAATAIVDAEVRRPFDLAGGQLLRARLVRLREAEHLLVITIHHIASDEGSKRVLFHELGVRYAAARAGSGPALRDLPVRYGDYAEWERERNASQERENELGWWRRQLAGIPGELALPYDAPRPPVFSFRGQRHVGMVDRRTLEGLRKLSREEGATLFMVLLAGLTTLLERYSDEADVAVASPVSSRTRPELHDLIGMFGNTVVLRTDASGNPSFRDLVSSARETVIGALEHQDVPFERLVDDLSDGRDLSRPPLASVLFNFIERPADHAPALDDLEVTAVDIDPGNAKFDLALDASVRGDQVRLLWEFNRDLFEPETIERMSGHLRRLLTAAVASPDTPIDALPLLSDEELRSETDGITATAAPIPDGCLHEHLTARARERPDAPAVACGADALTYRELDERVNAIAHALVDAEVPPGSVVGIHLPRSTDLLAAPLGVHRAGCAYLPLDPALPAARIAYMLEDSASVAVISDGTDGIDGDGPRRISLEAGTRAARPPARTAAPTDASHIIYTSGSTGRPKGVVVEQLNLLNVLASVCREPGVGPEDVVLAVTTLAFDVSAAELFAPLLAGGRVVISEDGVGADPRALAALIASERPTLMTPTPSTWRLLIDNGWPGAPGLRAVSTGEALPAALASQLTSRVAELWNLYGPSETTIWSAGGRVRPEDRDIPIGWPIANTACYVLDAWDRPVPPGVVGQLCIGGAGVARGYHNRPELTESVFVSDPFSPGARMYRTGDRARRRPSDGALLYLGRNDHQVKLRGFRIELGEVQAALETHDAVRQAAVVVREDRPEDRRLVAYVVPARDTTPMELRDHLAQTLPSYMLPSATVLLGELPLTPNGKLDRAALPEPDPGERPATTAPRTPVEDALADIWCEVLGRRDLGVDDNLFHFGAHSLLITRGVVRIQEALGVDLPLQDVWAAPTIAALATKVSNLLAGDDDLETLLAEFEGTP